MNNIEATIRQSEPFAGLVFRAGRSKSTTGTGLRPVFFIQEVNDYSSGNRQDWARRTYP
jgi:hypothetical protein